MTTSDKTWIKVAACASVPLREGRCVEIAGRSIAIFHTAEGFLAVDNRCLHRGGPLADGMVNGTSVVCPLHAWKFDLLSGTSMNHAESTGKLTTYPTRIHEGAVCIQLTKAAFSEEVSAVVCEQRDRPIRWVQRKLSPAAARPGNSINNGSCCESALPSTEGPQGNGYVSQEL